MEAALGITQGLQPDSLVWSPRLVDERGEGRWERWHVCVERCKDASTESVVPSLTRGRAHTRAQREEDCEKSQATFHSPLRCESVFM